jgi:hypothetical protein
MKLSTLPASLFLALSLTHCGKQEQPTEAPSAPKAAVGGKNDEELSQWRDALARQAMEVETRSALMEQQLAEMEQKLQRQENDTLRGQLDSIRQQNEALRTQADAARRQSDAISQKLAASTPPPPVITVGKAVSADYSLFYERLAPEGRWFDVTGYGYCFQPRVARVSTWRPYVDGCWSWTSLGWSWQSNEPFGWATYHYGRWVHLTQYGWLWVPGSEWAPAWVAWRQSRDHVGWAPLPPERGPCVSVQRDCDSRYGLGPASYTFIQTTNFIRPSYVTICHPVSYNSTIFRSTVNITQIVPCRDRARPNMFMHHGGPPRHHIEQTCRETMPERPVRPVHADDLTRSRSNPNVVRAPHEPVGVVELPRASASTHLPAIRADDRITRPQLVDAFAGVPASARVEIQQRLATEAARVRVADSARPLPAVVQLPPQPVVHSPPSSAVTSAGALTPVETVLPATIVPPAGGTASPPVDTAVTLAEPLARPRPDMPSVVSPSDLSGMVIPRNETPALTLQAGAPIASRMMDATTLPDLPRPSVIGVNAESALSPRVSEAPRLDGLTRTAVESPALANVGTNVEPNAGNPVNGDPAPAMPASGPVQTPAQPGETPALASNLPPQVDLPGAPLQASPEPDVQEAARQQTEAQAMQQRQADDAARVITEQEAARQQAEAPTMQQRQAADAARAIAEQEAARQQAEALVMQQRQAEEVAQRQATEEQMRRAQEDSQRQAAEAARQQAESIAMQQRQAEEAAQRQAQEEQMRQAQEAARQQAEAVAMEQQRQAAEEARRAQEEAMRRAQEEAQRQAAEGPPKRHAALKSAPASAARSR